MHVAFMVGNSDSTCPGKESSEVEAFTPAPKNRPLQLLLLFLFLGPQVSAFDETCTK